MRDHLKDLGLEKYLNELYGVYDSPIEIVFNSLPSCCILKCNHGAKYNIHIHDSSESDFVEAMVKLRKWLRQDYSLKYGELHYRDISRKILCERHLGYDIQDYKVECINGTPENVMVCTNPSQGPVKYYCYSREWEYLDILNTHHPDPHMKKPEKLNELLNMCCILSEDWPYVRIDTYIYEGEIVFGEMTFTPSGFIDSETLPEVKKRIGNLIKSPIPE